MRNATSAMLNADVHDLGSQSLDHEAKAFHDRWGYGIGKLADAADKMVGGLDATMKAYTDTEAHVAAYFQIPGADAVEPGPDDAGAGAAVMPSDPNSGIWSMVSDSNTGSGSPISRRMAGWA
jgi:hypothetical protein